MKPDRFNTRGIARLLAFLFVLYISISLLIIVFPGISFGKRVTQIYKRYVSPGPFFTASRITDSNLFYLSWKSNGEWVTPMNPPLIHYENFFAGWNPTYMYKSRLERSIYENAIREIKSKVDSADTKSFKWTNTYFQTNYVPVYADSIRIILVGNVTQHYKTKTDTIQIIAF